MKIHRAPRGVRMYINIMNIMTRSTVIETDKERNKFQIEMYNG